MVTTKKTYKDTVGGRIKELREDAGLTQEQLAEKLYFETYRPIENLENDKKELSAELLYIIAELFGVDTDYIMKGMPKEYDTYSQTAVKIVNNLHNNHIKQAAIEHLKAVEKVDRVITNNDQID